MKNKFNLSILAGLVGLGVVFTQSAFTNQTDVRYHYKLTTEAGIDMASNWELATDPNSIECGVSGSLPCVISIDGDLQTFLTQNPSSTELLSTNKVVSYKNPE